MDSKAIADCGLRFACLTMRCFIAGGLLGISATLVLADTPAERAASLSKLSPDQKEELLRKKQRFDALDPAEQQRLRELHAALSAGADAEQLHTTAVRYANWLKGLQPGERAEVLSLPADKRIVRIREIVSQQERQRFRDLSNLPPNDQEFVYQWLDKFVADNEKAILEAIPSYRDRRDIRETKDDRARRRILITRMSGRWFNPRMPFPSNDAINQMVAGLSETTRKELDKAKDDGERQSRSHQIVWAAIGSISVPPATEEELRKFYASLTAEKRSRLENMDPEGMQKELRQMYRREKLGILRGFPPHGPRSGSDRHPPGLASPNRSSQPKSASSR